MMEGVGLLQRRRRAGPLRMLVLARRLVRRGLLVRPRMLLLMLLLVLQRSMMLLFSTLSGWRLLGLWRRRVVAIPIGSRALGVVGRGTLLRRMLLCRCQLLTIIVVRLIHEFC